MWNRDRRDKHPPTRSRSAAWGGASSLLESSGWTAGPVGTGLCLPHHPCSLPQLPRRAGAPRSAHSPNPATVLRRLRRGRLALPSERGRARGLASSPQPHRLAGLGSRAGCALARGRALCLWERPQSVPAAASIPSAAPGNRTAFTLAPGTHLPGCQQPCPHPAERQGVIFQPVARSRDAAPTQRQSSSCAREERENELAAVQGARGPRDTVAEEMQPLQRQMTAAASAAACLCHTFLCPRHVAPGARSCSRPESRDGDKRAGGEAERRSAAGRVFQLQRWRGNTCSCPRCPPALALRAGGCTAGYSPRQLPLPYRAGQAAAGLLPVGTAGAVGQREVPGVSHSRARASLLLPPRAKLLRASQQGSQGPAPAPSRPPSPAPSSSRSLGSKPCAPGKCPRCPRLCGEMRDRAPVPAAFRGAPGGHRRRAGAARAPSRAGRGSICSAAPQGFAK